LRDFWLGDYKGIFLTWSEKNIGSSGATVRSLLQCIAENSDIPIISLMKTRDPLLPQYKLTNRESFKVDEVSESFYVHVQTGLEEVTDLQDEFYRLSNQAGSYKAVFVGLPCGVKLVKRRSSDIATIGLFCGGIHKQLALRLFLKRLKIGLEEITSLKFRISINKHCPDDQMHLEALRRKPEYALVVNRHTRNKTKFEKLFNSFFSGALHCDMCRHCTDMTAEYADVSVGDAWAVGLGRNICITRSDLGKNIVDEAVRLGYVSRETLSYERVIESQSSLLIAKKLGLWNWPKTLRKREKAFDAKARYWALKYSPPFEDVLRRKILREVGRVKGIQLYIPEIDRLLSLFFLQTRTLLRIVKRTILTCKMQVLCRITVLFGRGLVRGQ